jgi:predicted transcriptional regulator
MALRAICDAVDGLTTEELAERTGTDFSSIQPRTSELRRLGLIRDSGRRRRNWKGKRTIVWEATR